MNWVSLEVLMSVIAGLAIGCLLMVAAYFFLAWRLDRKFKREMHDIKERRTNASPPV